MPKPTKQSITNEYKTQKPEISAILFFLLIITLIKQNNNIRIPNLLKLYTSSSKYCAYQKSDTSASTILLGTARKIPRTKFKYCFKRSTNKTLSPANSLRLFKTVSKKEIINESYPKTIVIAKNNNKHFKTDNK